MNTKSTSECTYQVVVSARQAEVSEETQPAKRNQRLIGKLLRCRNNEVLKLRSASTNEQRLVEMPIK